MSARTYRIAPEWRRTTIIAALGCVLLAGTNYVVYYEILEQDWIYTVCATVCFAGMGAFMLLPWTSFVRVDDVGIKQRGLFAWGDWTWNDFASGRIVKDRFFTLYDPSRFWRRYLVLDYLADADRKEVMQRINEHYRLPDPPVLPDSLSIRFGFRRRLELLHGNIRVTIAGKTRDFGWQEVQRLRITRYDPKRRDWVRIILSLPGQEIELMRGEGGSVDGVATEEVNEFLFRHVPVDRIDEDILNECPNRTEDVQRELTLMDSNDRQARMCFWIIGGISVPATLITAAFEGGLSEVLVVAFCLVLLGLFFLLVVWLVLRIQRQKRMQLQSWFDQIQARTHSPT